MKVVLYYETGSGYGGSTTSLYQLLKAIDRARYRPIVVASSDGSTVEKIRGLGILVHVLGTRPRASGHFQFLRQLVVVDLPLAIRLIRLMVREHVDLIHLNNDVYSTIAGLLAGRLLGKPIVCHLRLTREPTRFERWIGRWASVKVTLTEDAKRFYERWWPHDRIECIPNGVEMPSKTPPEQDVLRQRLQVPATDRVVGLIARCVPGKGYEEFIQAAGLVSVRKPDVTFLILGHDRGGDVAYEQSLRALAGSLQLNGQLVWGGWQPDVRTIYGALDVVVQASSTFPEGASRVVLEAMACGRPVIATDIVGNRGAVIHQETGLLVPPGNAHALADAILTLVADTQLAARYGAAGRRRAAEVFSLEVHGRNMVTLYESLLKKRWRI